ncbi:MAG: SMP-30/gluconolactonase/LRE family protein [Desulfosarcinaceae bacterium]|nr:SMP-30/gluconolactonase/LRE family protein [Desulfosarcinaceae bacterium]
MSKNVIEIHDQRFLSVVHADAGLEVVANGFAFIEGPIWHPRDHHLTFSDIIGDTIYRWQADGAVSVLRKPSHMANGNTYDREGRILTCEHATSRVTRSAADGGRIETLASRYQGRELNSPNDIVVTSDGMIYFTDPNSGRGPKFGVERAQELAFQGVYRLDPVSGELTLLVDDFEKPNGLCFSLDEKILFINDTARQHIRAFDLSDEGVLINGRLWADLIGAEVGVADGMKVDSAGILFCTGPGGVHVYDADATLLGRIRVSEQAANFTWGDPDLKTLYITASTTLYRIRVRVPGQALF